MAILRWAMKVAIWLQFAEPHAENEPEPEVLALVVDAIKRHSDPTSTKKEDQQRLWDICEAALDCLEFIDYGLDLHPINYQSERQKLYRRLSGLIAMTNVESDKIMDTMRYIMAKLPELEGV